MKKKMTEQEAFEEINKNKERAKKIINDPKRFKEFIESLIDFLKTVKFDEKTQKYIKSLGWIVVSYWKKEYKEVPLKTILAAVGALIYLLMPIDIIPDNIPYFGHLDDISVITYCVKFVKEDLDKYLAWREENNLKPETGLELVPVNK